MLVARHLVIGIIVAGSLATALPALGEPAPKASSAKAKAVAAPRHSPTASPASSAAARSTVSADVLRALERGNADFTTGHAHHPHQDNARLLETAKGQKPQVTILSCSDSRVPAEILFDEGIGDVFSVRVAGNVADTDELGTIEYGVDHLGTPLLVVLGHTSCGAVTAVATGAVVHGHIPQLVDNIQAAVDRAKTKNPTLDPTALVGPAIVENVWQSIADIIQKSESVRARVEDGRVRVVGAVYHLDDGKVEWLGEHPTQRRLVAAGNAAPSEHGGADHGAGAPKGHDPKPASSGHEAHDAHAEPGGEGAVHAAAAAAVPTPPVPLAFAITAALASLAGGISVRVWSRGK